MNTDFILLNSPPPQYAHLTSQGIFEDETYFFEFLLAYHL